MEPEIPSKVRCSIDREAAKWVIRPEVTSTSLRKSANEHCAPENRHQKNIPNEAVFCFHGYIIAIELGFSQQVAAEALKNIPKRAKRVFLGSAVRAAESPQVSFNSKGGLQESLHEMRSH